MWERRKSEVKELKVEIGWMCSRWAGLAMGGRAGGGCVIEKKEVLFGSSIAC